MQGKKMKVWLTKDSEKDYAIHHNKPQKFLNGKYYQGYIDNVILDVLCPKAVKKYMGLSKHLKKEEILEGTMEFEWKEVICKTKQER